MVAAGGAEAEWKLWQKTTPAFKVFFANYNFHLSPESRRKRETMGGRENGAALQHGEILTAQRKERCGGLVAQEGRKEGRKEERPPE